MCNFFNVLLVPKRDIWKRSAVAQHHRGGGPDVTVRPRGTGGSPAPRHRISRRRVLMWLRPRAPTAQAQPPALGGGCHSQPSPSPGLAPRPPEGRTLSAPLTPCSSRPEPHLVPPVRQVTLCLRLLHVNFSGTRRLSCPQGTAGLSLYSFCGSQFPPPGRLSDSP